MAHHGVVGLIERAIRRSRMSDFIHLHLHSPYSFLDGGSDIDSLVRRAALQGANALALTDHNSLCAAVKFSAACESHGIRPILGSEITLEDETHLTLLARNRTGYARLCKLITEAYHHGGRLQPRLPWDRLLSEASSDIICLSGCRHGRIASFIQQGRLDDADRTARELQEAFGAGSFHIELQDDLTPGSLQLCADLVRLAHIVKARVVATNNVHHADRDDFIAHDILRCIAAGVHVDQIHPLRPLNAERCLKSPADMRELFAWCPDAISETVRISEACEPALPGGEDITPSYAVPPGYTPASYLRELTYRGAQARFDALTPAITRRLDYELKVIGEMGYADYFLMVWDIVRWTRKQGIRCTGRGSAADCCVAFCLYLTDVDVIARNLPFARFLSPGRIPDIDMDFPSDRRDEVFQHIIDIYGSGHVGMVCTFYTFWARSAVRNIGKALDLPPDAVDFLARRLHFSVRADRIEAAFDRYAELRPHQHLIERFRMLLDLCRRISGFPRHIGTHSSGIVISAVPLNTIAPLQPSARGISEIWTLDKDDAEEVGAIKFDVLSLRTLSAVADAEGQIQEIQPDFRYDQIPLNDPDTYRTLQASEAVGAFQLESAGQLALAAVLVPRHFEDLVASVALIRPGPIRGNIVRRFVACRNGWTRVDWAHPCLIPILAKTYGCIVFQEQANEVIAAMTGCSDAEADRFRKSLKRHAKLDTMEEPRRWFIERSIRHRPAISEERLSELFEQIEGWSGYGFIEGHAAAFALTGCRTAYLSVHHPAEYFAAMMSHQPMGFYNANTLAGEARRRGVHIQPVDINDSCDKCVAVGHETIQLGFRIVDSIKPQVIKDILEARRDRPYRSLLDFCARVVLPRDLLENLILCGAFDRLHEHRRGILWRLDETLGMAQAYRSEATGGGGYEGQGSRARFYFGDPAAYPTPTARDIPDFHPWDKFLWTWRLTGICAECHAVSYMREQLERWRVRPVIDIHRLRARCHIRAAGLNIRPHRPPTRSGEPVLFAQIEDETGLLPVTVSGNALNTCTPVFLTCPALIVEGLVERRGRSAVLNVERAVPLALRDADSFADRRRAESERASEAVAVARREYASVP